MNREGQGCWPTSSTFSRCGTEGGEGGWWYVVLSVGAHERKNDNVLVAPLKAVDRVNLGDERKFQT
jgi:hypothetical protein